MKSALKKLKTDITQNKLPLCIVVLYLSFTQILFGCVCPFKIITGMDCPGCGLTRGCLCVLTGRVVEAISYNPMSFAWVGLLGWLGFERYFLEKEKIHWELPVIVISMLTILLWGVETLV